MATVEILGSHMAYVAVGQGDTPVVFLHGNPASSYLWRKVMPHVAARTRCLAPDLIGMGASGKPDVAYRFADHARYLDAWFEALNLGDVVLVGHDWGGALGLDWAARHPGRVKGVVLLETFLRPLNWSEYSGRSAEFFRALRTPGAGEQMVFDHNHFIEVAVPATTIGAIAAADMDAYRAPFVDCASRRPMLQWARETPIDGEPADVHERFIAYGRWMAETPDVPKLLLTFEPGAMVSPGVVAWCAEHVAGLEVESAGRAHHNAPEDQPDAIGQAIARWIQRHRLSGLD